MKRGRRFSVVPLHIPATEMRWKMVGGPLQSVRCNNPLEMHDRLKERPWTEINSGLASRIRVDRHRVEYAGAQMHGVGPDLELILPFGRNRYPGERNANVL